MTEEVSRGYRIEIRGARSVTEATSGPQHGVLNSSRATGDNPDEEVLLIDGKPIPFVRSPGGYSIYYLVGFPTLLDAARAYVGTQSEKTP
jgi:hypothetical protein